MNIEQLSSQITQVHDTFYKKATAAVNISLTLRNWFIGYYIVEYEQHGEDRAKYGEKIYQNLSNQLKHKGLKNVNERELRRFRNFYNVYNYFANAFLAAQSEIRGTLSPILSKFQIRGTLSPESKNNYLIVPAEKILTRLSYSHLEELIDIENPLKRAFYEVECINGVCANCHAKSIRCTTNVPVCR